MHTRTRKTRKIPLMTPIKDLARLTRTILACFRLLTRPCTTVCWARLCGRLNRTPRHRPSPCSYSSWRASATLLVATSTTSLKRDGVPLGSLTKNSPERGTDAHLSVVGHITQDELVKRLTSTDASNGFANRFVYVATQRARLLPHGGDLDALERAIQPHIQAVCAALDWAKTPRRLARDKEAYTLWEHEYERLSTGHPGLFGAVTARAEAQVTRIARIYATLDPA